VLVGWVLFRSHSLPQALDFLRAMLGFGGRAAPAFAAGGLLTPNIICYLVLATLCAFWPEAGPEPGRLARIGRILRPLAALTVTALALIAQAPQTFNPFIYFQF